VCGVGKCHVIYVTGYGATPGAAETAAITIIGKDGCTAQPVYELKQLSSDYWSDTTPGVCGP
jgi:hypothetical protein